MSEPLNSEKRGCRECGEVNQHTLLCPLDKPYTKVGRLSPVFDSERSPERHEFCDCLMPLGSKTCHHCKKPVRPAPQPQLEAALCAECHHDRTLYIDGLCRFIWLNEYNQRNICGHRCTFPAPVEADDLYCPDGTACKFEAVVGAHRTRCTQAVEAPAIAETCKWDVRGAFISTACDQKFYAVPDFNIVKFCSFCGKEISHEQ